MLRFLSSFVATKRSAAGGAVAHVVLRKPVLGLGFWPEFKSTLETLHRDKSVRCILVSGEARSFSFGLDLKDKDQMAIIMSSKGEEEEDPAARSQALLAFIAQLQSSLTVMEDVDVPVVALVHDYCFGGAVDLACCADIRWCTADAKFSIKEVDVGMAPDLGTLQRIERIVGSSSLVRELAFTGRVMGAAEAKECGFVSRVFATREEMMLEAERFGECVADKSPIAITGIKRNLLYSRDSASVKQALDFQAVWSSVALQSPDVARAVSSALTAASSPAKKKKDA